MDGSTTKTSNLPMAMALGNGRGPQICRARCEMARSKELEGRHIEYLRGHIGSFINTHPHPALEKGATFLGESFEIWSLRVNGVISDRTSNPDLSRYLFSTGNWHHQILQNGVAVAYAVSGPSASFGGGWSLRGLFASDLAKKVTRAIV